MEKDQIIILEDRGLISIEGPDAKDFLQNIISNDVSKVSESSSIFSGIFTPQGKYLYEFFIIKNSEGFLLDCDNIFKEEYYLRRLIFTVRVTLIILRQNL